MTITQLTRLLALGQKCLERHKLGCRHGCLDGLDDADVTELADSIKQLTYELEHNQMPHAIRMLRFLNDGE